MNSFRIDSQQEATGNGRKGRIVTLYNGAVHVGKYFVPTWVCGNKAAIEYALDVRAETDETDFNGDRAGNAN